MIGRKNKVQPDVIDLSNESLTRVLESLKYRKGVRFDVAFEHCPFKQLQNKSLFLSHMLKNHFKSFLILGGYTYRFDRHDIERTHPNIKPDKQRKWLQI